MCTVVEYCNVGPAGRVRCCGKNDANSSKQGSKRFNSITKTLPIYRYVIYVCVALGVKWSCYDVYSERTTRNHI